MPYTTILGGNMGEKDFVTGWMLALRANANANYLLESQNDITDAIEQARSAYRMIEDSYTEYHNDKNDK
jgi:SLT domain-containing protein